MNSLLKRTRLAPLFLLASRAAWAGGGGLLWETPLNTVAQSLTGPVALSISLIALMVAGGTLVFGGELSGSPGGPAWRCWQSPSWCSGPAS